MTKRTSLLLSVCGVVALSACGSTATSSGSSVPPDEDVEVVDVADDVSAGDDISVGDDVVLVDLDDDAVQDDAIVTDLASDKPAPEASPPNEAPASSSSSFETPIGAAGTVELVVDGNSVTLAAVDYADGWNETSRSVNGGDVDLDVRSEIASIDFDADVESSTILEVKVDTDWQLSAGTYVETTVAGDVTITSDGSGMAFGAFNLNDGWEITGQSSDSDEITVTISDRSSADTVRVTAEVDDGKGEIETRTSIALDR